MSAIDVEQMLSNVSEESPCGEDLEYDAGYGELERSSQSKPEQQIGETIVPAEDPDWRVVKRQALELWPRTRDLRIAALLARTLLWTDGLPGFADGLQLVHGLIDRHWDDVHPRLDPDDDNDPTLRVNTVASLCDADTTVRAIREAALVSSRSVGRFCLRDVMVANGEFPPPADGVPPEKSTIDAAFMDVPVEELQATFEAVQTAIAELKAIEASLTDQVGAANSVQLAPAVQLLVHAEKTLAEPLSRRSETPLTDEDGGEPAAGNGAAPAAQRLTGEIQSREDVLRAIDKICQYYDRHEPSSPIPLLLNRAKRLATKSFMEIIRDLTPDGLTQAMTIGGVAEEEQQY